ncbi:sensor histidine kinase [Pontixanthobacter aquaemixtae]|nr:sensor histidine kinase [Pontixanthobacter aquaemixtae]
MGFLPGLAFAQSPASPAMPPETQVGQISPVILGDDPLLYATVRDSLQYYRDPELTKSVHDIASAPADFQSLSSRHVDFGLTNDRIWLKWEATNTRSKPNIFRIDMKRQYFTELRLFELVEGGEPLLLLDHEQEDPFAQRDIPSRFLLADIPFEPGETKTFLIGFRSSTTTFLPLAVGTVDGVTANHQAELSVDLFLNGMLVAMIVYSLLLMPVIGWRLATSFAAYIGAGAFYVIVADGYPMQTVWPDAAWLNEPMNLASMLSMTALGLNLCRQLFRFDAISPNFDRALIALLGIAALCVPLAFAFIAYEAFFVPAYFLPPLANIFVCLAGVFALRHGRIGALPFLLGAMLVFASLVYATAAHLIPGALDLDATLDFGHIALLGECLAFALAILLRFLSLRRQRDDALAAELEASQEQLKLNERLAASQRDFEEAKSHAEQGQRQLSEMSHDIRQPLMVIKDALARLARFEGAEDKSLGSVVGYLEGIARAQGHDADSVRLPDDEGFELFPVGVLLDNIVELYTDQAHDKGVSIAVHGSGLQIRSHPISLMRVLSNLVDNALSHGEGDKILLAARKRNDGTRIEVWNNGRGLSANKLRRLKARGAKGTNSQGSGLGLHIVERICQELGHSFEFRSQEDTGSVAFIWLSDD